jgi:hypothetical protein
MFSYRPLNVNINEFIRVVKLSEYIDESVYYFYGEFLIAQMSVDVFFELI